jgi:hypothetical protein
MNLSQLTNQQGEQVMIVTDIGPKPQSFDLEDATRLRTGTIGP